MGQIGNSSMITGTSKGTTVEGKEKVVLYTMFHTISHSVI